MQLNVVIRRTVLWLFAGLTTLVALSGSVKAQTATPNALQDVPVAVTVVGQSGRLASEMVGLPVQNRLLQDFAAAGYRLLRAQPDQAEWWVQLTSQADQSLAVAITPSADLFAALPSDVLMPLTTPLTFSGPQGDALTETIAQTTVALHVAVRDCVSTPVTSSALSESDVALISGTIDFYAGNCSLTAGENASAAYLDALDSLAQPGVPFSARIAPSVNLAWVAFHQGRSAVAQETLTRLLADATDPADRVLILRKRSALLALDFRFEEAIADMNAAIALVPDDPALYVELGQRILLTYEWDQVLAAYDKAIEIDPTYAPAYFRRGILFYTEGPRANALRDFSKYLELAPDGEYAAEASDYIGGIQQTTAGEIEQGK